MPTLRAITNKESFWGYVFITPIMIGFFLFMLYPLLASLSLSLTKSDGITPATFIGIKNYQMLITDERFINSLLVTLVYVVGTVPMGVALALLVALLLNQKIRFIHLYRTAYFIPYITSMVAVATVWKWLYNTDYGLINGFLSQLGLFEPPWLSKQGWAMLSIIIMSIWKGLGFNLVIFLAGLQNISPSMYEAAKIDGANAFQRFFYITIPLLRHTTLFVMVMAIIGSFQVFDQVFVMTNGGPANSTSVIVYYVYQNAFLFFKQGYASAMAYVLFAIIFVATWIQLKISNRKDVI
ncbi:sugar ABC transporter permease [Bacillus sp. FJAT-49711]|uniref:carbohydrate ABC transporter permease n=1 Tax=Bacillus sp. FJAT-49711 TaxID=2833585 RepID=UPI001BC9DA35|nr:sugar ABC transporter permease [Bacillus sp. FJAT-49711]MBS4219056.1 sugar ABC transporter permease [Bacillus sp. FJAT-49711]